VTLAAYQDPVQALGAYGAYPSFGIGVCPRRPGRDLDYLGTGRGEHRVEGSAELSVAVADEEPEPGGALAQVDEQIAGGLGDPGAGGARGDARQADPATLQFDEEQGRTGGSGRWFPQSGSHTRSSQRLGNARTPPSSGRHFWAPGQAGVRTGSRGPMWADTATPSLRHSPTIRRYPQRRFSLASRTTSPTTSSGERRSRCLA
jgi:hypothetical protein